MIHGDEARLNHPHREGRGNHPRKLVAVIARLALCLGLSLAPRAAPTWASEISILHYNRGLATFHRRDYAGALDDFDIAVAADPEDPIARYYRGVTRARVGDRAGAIEDLETALRLRPDLAPAGLELGIALLEDGRPRQALAPLTLAFTDPELDTKARFFMGLALLRLDRWEDAAAAFEAVARSSDLALPGRYYLGVTRFRQRRWGEAAAAFEQVHRDAPADDALRREAEEFLQIAERVEKPYELTAAVGLAYDSNLTLTPNDPNALLGATGEADGRVTLAAGGRYALVQAPSLDLVVAYDFLQWLQFRQTDFDLQTHRPSAMLTVRAGAGELGFRAAYEYALLKTSSYYQEVVAMPWIGFEDANRGRAEMYFRMAWRDYKLRPYSERLNAYDYAAGFRTDAYLDGPTKGVWVGFAFDRYDTIDPAGAAFAYNGYQPEAGVFWYIQRLDLGTELGYRFRYDDYDLGRIDREHGVSFALRRDLSEHFSAAVYCLANVDNSNQPAFTYNRQIAGVELRGWF